HPLLRPSPTRRSSDLEDPEQLLEEVSAGRFKPLAELGVRDASLAELVTIGLSGNLAERQTDIGDLVRALEDWLKFRAASAKTSRSEEHTSELQSRENL